MKLAKLFGINRPPTGHFNRRSEMSSCQSNESVTDAYYAVSGARARSLVTTFEPGNDSSLTSAFAVEQCASFCPSHLSSVPPIGNSWFFNGCCMLADISGFTKLSSALCAEGAVGLDKLRLITDDSFAKFVNIIYSHGGDVIAFAGDCLVCVFLPDPQEATLQGCSLRAVQCGLDITKCVMDGTQTHVAVSSGRMCMALLGGHNYQRAYVMNGPCLESAGTCLSHAGAQELVITGGVLKPIEGMVMSSLVTEHRGTENFFKVTHCFPSGKAVERCWRVPQYDRPGGCSVDSMVSCVPAPVAEAIRFDVLSSIKEIRTVTTLFMRLDTYNSMDFEDVKTLQPFFIVMQKCLEECGGFLRQFLIDDKGCVLIGLWGVPTATHPANCSKALRCAVLMKHHARALDLSVSIGITTGSAYCGTVGTDYRRDYVAIGRSVNLAARLMVKAAGRILLDKETLVKLPLDISTLTSPTEELNMKGIPQGEKYHCYDSTVIPRRVEADVREDFFLGIEGYIRRRLNIVIDIVGSAVDNSSEQHASDIDLSQTAVEMLTGQADDARHSSQWQPLSSVSTSSVISFTPVLSPRSPVRFSYKKNSTPPTEVFVIKGISGSGKTAIVNHLIHRLSVHEKNQQLLKRRSVYVSLRRDNDTNQWSSIRKIFFALLPEMNNFRACTEREVIVELFRNAFPDYSCKMLGSYIFPLVRNILGISWEWFDGDQNISDPRKELSRESATVMAELIYYMLSSGISILAIDNAHFLCVKSWEVMTLLGTMGCSALLVLTIRVHGTSSGISSLGALISDDSSLRSPTKDDLLESTFSRSTMFSRQKENNLSSTVVPSRHSAEYVHFCEALHPGCLHSLTLRPLAERTIAWILRHGVLFTLSDESVGVICSISQGNPFLLWSIISHLKDMQTDDIDSVVSNLKDSSLTVSMLERVPQINRVIVKAASIIGAEFDIEVLREVLPKEHEELMDTALRYLENTGFLVSICDGVMGFTSGLMRKYIYELVPPSDAQAIHAEVANSIVRLHNQELAPHMFSLCYHYSRSDPKVYEQLAFGCACQAVELCIKHQEIETFLPYLELAVKRCSDRQSKSRLLNLLAECVATATSKLDNIPNSDSLETAALNYTLEKLQCMYSTQKQSAGIATFITHRCNAIIQAVSFISATRKVTPSVLYSVEKDPVKKVVKD